MGAIWGVPYLLIRVAVEQVSPVSLVFARTTVAAALLVPVAARAGALGSALRRWRWVLGFAAIECAVPWVLLGEAERQVSSSLAGLVIAAVPIAGAGLAYFIDRDERVTGLRLAGLAVGIAGVAALLGLDLRVGQGLAALELLGTALCYATGPLIVKHRLADVPSTGVIALTMAATAVATAPAAWLTRPRTTPDVDTVLAVLALALVCTALAFLLFFALIGEVGPARATVITYVNPAVAVGLGVLVLDEPLTLGLVAGFALVLAGSWLATTGGWRRRAPAPVAA
jgi:drug/metabolite transporter (DMT)-like permease